jgi:hypothetical protein
MRRLVYEWIYNTTSNGITDIIEKGLNTTARLYLIARRMHYQIHKKRSEAFFERGRLYQLVPSNPELPSDFALYSLEDIEFAIEEADRADFTPFLLKKATKSLRKGDLFMLVEIRRYRFDYCILKALVGDQVSGIILYNNAAMYPWEVFTDISG